MAAQFIPEWLQGAFSDWILCKTYISHGNYRSKATGRIVPYNRALKRLYPDNEGLHAAAHAWLALWEHVPTARL
jgi:hypothetical protein